MKDSADKVTMDLLPVKRGRGRPKTGTALTGAERVRLYREKHGLVPFTVDLPGDLVAAVNDYLAFKDVTKNDLIAKLIRSQLLRKR